MTAELPSGINLTVARSTPPKSRKTEPYNGQRQWLTEAEIDRLMTTARKQGRYGHRDAMMVLLAYRHGFRVSELVRLQWQDIDWERGLIHCRRVKNGTGCASLMVETSRTSSGEGIVEKIANLRQKIEK